MKLYERLKKTLSEVQEPLSQGEKNFKALHNPVDHKNLVPGVTDQEHVFKGLPRREDPKSASYENFRDDDESTEAYDKTLKVKEEEEKDVDIDEAARTDTYIGTIHKDDPDYESKLADMKKKAVGGHRVRGRAPLEKFKHLYKKGGALHRFSSQDVKPEHSARVDVYSRKAMKKEEVEQVEEQKNQYIEVKNKHTGAVRHIEVHPSRAFEALNKYKDKNNDARIVAKKPMKEEVEQIDELSKTTKLSYVMKASSGKKSPSSLDKQASLDAEREKNDSSNPAWKKRKEYWQNKSAKRTAGIAKAKADLTKEDTEQVDEVLTKKTPIGTWISDFVHSKNPKFAGKSKKERMKQAMAAYYSKKRNEAVDQEDWEGFMAKTELSAIADKAGKLSEKISESQELEAWVQSKISYAKMQIDGVYDYMMYSGVNEEVISEKKGDDEDESDRAANKNIINQMRKAPVDGMHKITFENGKKHMIEPKHVAKALEIHANTPVAKGAREAVQNALAHSHEHFMHVVKHGKPPVQAAKPKVSLGSMRKESVDVNTRESGKGAREAVMVTGPDGRPRVKYFTPARKEIKVTSEELKGNQHKIDANHNGKIDGQDFKLLRKRKKVQEAEEMTAANVAKAAATQTKFGVVGDKNMQQDSIDKMKSDPLASKEKVSLPPTQGNKPIGGDTQTHANVAEHEEILSRLYDTLSEQNKAKFEEMLETEEGMEYLLHFAKEQGI